VKLQVFCHVFAGGWRQPVDDLIEAFNSSGLKSASPELRLGVIGPSVGREAVLVHFAEKCELQINSVVGGKYGNEWLTINKVREWAINHPGEAVLYCHSKGAARPLELNDHWRRAMIEHLIVPWRDVLTQLENDVDAAGCFWLDPKIHLPPREGWWINSFFAGNFWMARTNYLSHLPECVAEPRVRAEEWIGLRNPRILDLLPGYPSWEFFGLDASALL
jgi:hypothetical protein